MTRVAVELHPVAIVVTDTTRGMAPIGRSDPEAPKAEKVPKPVLNIRKALAEHNAEPTVENLQKFVSKKDLNNLASNLRNTMSAEAKDMYSKLSTDADRRMWLAQYVVDPKQVTARGFNRTTAFDKASSDSKAEWLTETQIAKELNDPDTAKLLVSSGDLQERPHEFPSLAKQGMKQYLFSRTSVMRSTGFMDEGGVEGHTELKDTEFSEVKDNIIASFGKGAQKRRIVAKEPESDEKRRRKEVQSQRNTSSRKVKSLIDRASNDIMGLERELPKLADKGYPEQMQVWCKERIMEMRAHIEQGQAVYNMEVTKVNRDSASVEDLKADGRRLDDALQTLEAAYSQWKTKGGSEVRKLIA